MKLQWTCVNVHRLTLTCNDIFPIVHVLQFIIDLNMSNFANLTKLGLKCSYQRCFYFVKVYPSEKETLLLFALSSIRVCMQSHISTEQTYNNMHIIQNVNFFMNLHTVIHEVSAGQLFVLILRVFYIALVFLFAFCTRAMPSWNSL